MNLIVEKIVTKDNVIYVVRYPNGAPVDVCLNIDEVGSVLNSTFQSVTKTNE